jgi:type IV pilus assembly protein PilE
MPASTADPSRPAVRLRMRRNAVLGFTLIELMIAVAIVALLAAVAMPSYQSYIRKGNRADATSLLQAVQLAQEKHRLGNATYAKDFASLDPPCKCNSTSERGHYSVAISGDSATGYTLTANAESTMQKGDTGCTAIKLKVTGGTIEYGLDADGKKCWSK